MDLLDQSGPTLSVRFGGTCRFQDMGYPFIPVLFFPFARGDITMLDKLAVY
jgi:hypothetical protein